MGDNTPQGFESLTLCHNSLVRLSNLVNIAKPNKELTWELVDEILYKAPQ